MAIGFEQDGWPQVQPQRREARGSGLGDSPAAPACDWPQDWPQDWQALHARLAAAHAFRRAMPDAPALWRRAEGSFDAGAARVMRDYRALARTAGEDAVNRTGLADGKSPADNLVQVVDASARGDRGY